MFFMIIRAPPTDIEFPERVFSGASQGQTEQPKPGRHRYVEDEVWAARKSE